MIGLFGREVGASDDSLDDTALSEDHESLVLSIAMGRVVHARAMSNRGYRIDRCSNVELSQLTDVVFAELL